MKRIVVGIIATTMATMGSAHAALTTFTFAASDKGQTSIFKSLDGINLTIGSFLTGPLSGAGGNGLAVYCLSATGTNLTSSCIHSGSFKPYSSFTMTFDNPVKLLAYNISGIGPLAVGSTTIYAQGSSQSVQENTGSPGGRVFVNQFVAVPNVPVTVSTVDTDGTGALAINALTVEKVDVPGPLPLAGAAAAFSWSRRLRGRIARV
jgi:hypothetical protein